MERKGEKSNVGLITLNRPKALNALSDALMLDVANALDELESDNNIGAIVLTGSQKAFAGTHFLSFPLLASGNLSRAYQPSEQQS